jgi:hypothetical protein
MTDVEDKEKAEKVAAAKKRVSDFLTNELLHGKVAHSTPC